MTDEVSRWDRERRQDEEPWRSAAHRDSDRLIWASAFRRLTEVTQVMPSRQAVLFHNRLTHFIKVAQYGRGCAAYLLHKNPALASHLDEEVVYAAGLAHDLGHPPFGHIAEEALQEVLGDEESPCRLPDSFEGNAQTFRILTKLSAKKAGRESGRDPDGYGLNLTRATLAASTKYPWHRGEWQDFLQLSDEAAKEEAALKYGNKWGAYASEGDQLTFVQDLLTAPHRSLEAELMDWADDISYAIHDLEDFFRAGLIPLEILGAGFRGSTSQTFDSFWAYAARAISGKKYLPWDDARARQSLKGVAEFFPESPYTDSDQDRVRLHGFSSTIVNQLQNTLTATIDEGLDIPEAATEMVEVFKQMTWYFVIEHPSLGSVQRGQARVIKKLHAWLCEWVETAYEGVGTSVQARNRAAEKKRRLPPRLQSLMTTSLKGRGSSAYGTEKARISRAVTDYISSLTEAQALALYGRLNGGGNAEVLEGRS